MKNDVDVLSLSSKLDFEGKTQTFTKSNEDQLNTQKLLDSYSKSQNAFLTTLVNFKDQTDKGQTIENQEAIKPLLNKYSKDTLKSTETKYKIKTPVVSSIVIGGSLANLNKLNVGKVKAISVKSEVTNIKEIEKQANELKAKIDKVTTQEAKDKILKDEIAKVLPVGTEQSSLNLDQAKIQEIEKLKKVDIGGNIYINKEEVKLKLGLTDIQVTEISKAMNSYNQLPQELKDNSVGAIQAITQTTQLKIEEYNQKDLGEKVSQLFLGSVKAEAGNGICTEQGYVSAVYWWGYTAKENKCRVARIARDLSNFLTVFAVFTATACGIAASYFVVPGIICGAVFGTLIAIYTTQSNNMNYAANFCDNMTSDINWWGGSNFYCS